MPLYLYQHPESEEVIEVVQSVKDKHEYIDNDGTTWNRVWTVHNAAIDSQNDGSQESFMKYTKDKCGTIGDLWDASKEASEKRKSKEGYDSVENKRNSDYSKKRKGMLHPDQKKNNSGSTLEI